METSTGNSISMVSAATSNGFGSDERPLQGSGNKEQLPRSPGAVSMRSRRDREPSPPSTQPLVSVVVPVRNGERTIEACVTSILGNDYAEGLREIVVVDNASTDRTADIVRRYPVKYVHAPTRGRSHARNRGIQSSEGRI